MTILVDHQIQRYVQDGRIKIMPYMADLLQPASYDMRLARTIRTIDPAVSVLDPLNVESYTVETEIQDSFLLFPGEFVLASSIEHFTFEADFIGQVNGKSSLARIGLQIESAGFFDPGFSGTATLELMNMTNRPIKLTPGMAIAQMVFFKAESAAKSPYGSATLGSKYQGQSGPTEAHKPAEDLHRFNQELMEARKRQTFGTALHDAESGETVDVLVGDSAVKQVDVTPPKFRSHCAHCKKWATWEVKVGRPIARYYRMFCEEHLGPGHKHLIELGYKVVDIVWIAD